MAQHARLLLYEYCTKEEYDSFLNSSDTVVSKWNAMVADARKIAELIYFLQKSEEGFTGGYLKFKENIGDAIESELLQEENYIHLCDPETRFVYDFGTNTKLILTEACLKGCSDKGDWNELSKDAFDGFAEIVKEICLEEGVPEERKDWLSFFSEKIYPKLHPLVFEKELIDKDKYLEEGAILELLDKAVERSRVPEETLPTTESGDNSGMEILIIDDDAASYHESSNANIEDDSTPKPSDGNSGGTNSAESGAEQSGVIIASIPGTDASIEHPPSAPTVENLVDTSSAKSGPTQGDIVMASYPGNDTLFEETELASTVENLVDTSDADGQVDKEKEPVDNRGNAPESTVASQSNNKETASVSIGFVKRLFRKTFTGSNPSTPTKSAQEKPSDVVFPAVFPYPNTEEMATQTSVASSAPKLELWKEIKEMEEAEELDPEGIEKLKGILEDLRNKKNKKNE